MVKSMVKNSLTIIALVTMLYSTTSHSHALPVSSAEQSPKILTKSHQFTDSLTLNDNFGISLNLLSPQDMQRLTMACESELIDSRSCLVHLNDNSRRNLVEDISSHHSIGLFINSDDIIFTKIADLTSTNDHGDDKSVVYDFGLGYNYYFNEANASGFNFGAHFYRFTDKRYNAHKDTSGVHLELGYRF